MVDPHTIPASTDRPAPPSAREIVDAVLRCKEAGDLTGFAALFAEDAVFELPYAGEGRPIVRTGAGEIRAWLSEGSAARPPRPETTRETVVYETTDPEVVVVEYESHPKETPGGDGTYVPRYISVIRVRDGKVVRFRHYAEPSKWLRSMGGEAV